MQRLKKVALVTIDWIEWFNRKWGLVGGIMIFMMMLSVSYDVISREFFSQASEWSLDITILLQLVMVFMVAGYTLLHEAHVSVDVVHSRLPPRAQAITGLVTTLLGLVFVLVLFWQALDMTIDSIAVGKIWWEGVRFPMYWRDILISLGCLFFALQLIVRVTRVAPSAFSKSSRLIRGGPS